MATDRWMRASDQDRERAAEMLSEAYSVGRMSREELDERATAAYSAKTIGELHDLTADLPLPAARTGLPSDTMALRRAPRRADRPLAGPLVWMFFVLVLAAELAGLVTPVAVWLAMIPIPLALLLPPTFGTSRQCTPARERGRHTAAPSAATRPRRGRLRPGRPKTVGETLGDPPL